jgi:hypothetical protein
MFTDLVTPDLAWKLMLIAIWTLPWKGVALWKAARHKELKWFVALLIINTLAALEILYIFFFSKEARNKRKKAQHLS